MDDGNRDFLEATLPHLDAVYRVARNLRSAGETADDLVQETYLRAFAAFDRHEVENVRAWLVTICLNLARSRARRRSRRVEETSLEGHADEPIAKGNVAEEALARLDRASITAALAQLPQEQRVAIVLMDLAGLSAAEAARSLRCSRNTVLSRAFRGRKRLAAILVANGVDSGLL